MRVKKFSIQVNNKRLAFFSLSIVEAYVKIYKELYEKSNRKVEFVSEVLRFVIVKVTVPAAILPIAFISYYKYFTSTDLGSDAFELPAPFW